jgi:hypothetical protein
MVVAENRVVAGSLGAVVQELEYYDGTTPTSSLSERFWLYAVLGLAALMLAIFVVVAGVANAIATGGIPIPGKQEAQSIGQRPALTTVRFYIDSLSVGWFDFREAGAFHKLPKLRKAR